MKKILVTLLVAILIICLGMGSAIGFLWYRDNHVFVGGKAYSIHSVSLDLREEDLSVEEYDSLRSQLPNCEISWQVPFQDGKIPNDADTITVSSLTQQELEILLNYFPNLKTLDATGCQEYALLESFRESKPDCQVIYQVDLGGSSFDWQSQSLELQPQDYGFDTLMTNLAYLPNLESLTLHTPELSLDQVEQLKAAYETVAVQCTVELLGKEYDTQTTELDLSDLTPDAVEAVAEKLGMLENLTNVELMDENGESQLSKENVLLLMQTAPDVVFNYTFEYCGLTLSTSDEEVEIKNQNIGDEGEEELRSVLDLLTNCKRIVLDNCKLSNEVLSQLRDDYRDRTKVVWRVWFGGGSTLTDAEVIRCTYDLVDDNCEDLIYCEDVRFMDIGHNEYLDGVPFVAGMPNLEYIIVSGAPIKDLTPFENCKKLKFLEIAFCEYIEDLSPLAGCESLEMLNISNTHVTDLSPLDDLPLTHLCARLNPAGGSRVPKEEQERFIEQHPDCWASFTGSQPYGVGWRYDEDEITPLPQYALIQEAFQYPHAPNNTGWYLEEETEEAD